VRGASGADRTGVRRWVPTAVIGALLLGLLLTWGGWLVSGGSLHWVASPSMGMAIPEGSLVASQPVAAGHPLRVGEAIVFREPGTTTVFVHRVVRVLPGGRSLTKGDLERTPDPWIVLPSDVIGSVQASIPAIGWIYHSATWLFLSSAVLLAMSMFVGRRARRWLLLLGPVVVLAVPLLRYHPLVDGYVLGTSQHGAVGAAHIVDSGVLPVHFTVPGGRSVYSAPGQAVDVTGRVPRHGTGPGGIPIHIAAALPWWGWLVVVLVCLSPLAVLELDVRRARRAAPESEPEPEPGHGGTTPAVGDAGVAAPR